VLVTIKYYLIVHVLKINCHPVSQANNLKQACCQRRQRPSVRACISGLASEQRTAAPAQSDYSDGGISWRWCRRHRRRPRRGTDPSGPTCSVFSWNDKGIWGIL